MRGDWLGSAPVFIPIPAWTPARPSLFPNPVCICVQSCPAFPRLVLASPETATDLDYSRIEGVVGHEYFHNWTGNRVTCRDWFQLTLKEGLTVYRDQVRGRGRG